MNYSWLNELCERTLKKKNMNFYTLGDNLIFDMHVNVYVLYFYKI